jgi:hypothetical protein
MTAICGYRSLMCQGREALRGGRRFRVPGSTAALAAKPPDEAFKGHVALALDQQTHRVANRTAATMQLNHALRPIGELVRRAELRRVHPPIKI